MMYSKFFALLISILLLERAFATNEAKADASRIQPSDRLCQLFEQIEKTPKQSSVAEASSQLGYHSVSHFYQGTADYLDSKDIVRHKSKEGGAWLCPESIEQARSLLSTSKEIERLLRKGQSREALEHAEGELKSQGLSCRAMVEWSRVVLVSANDSPIAGLQKPDEELAVRWLLTAAEEIKLYPLGLEGEATTYSFLSDYFLSKKDYVSAYVSTFLALKNLRSGSLSLIDENRLNEKLDFLKTVLEK